MLLRILLPGTFFGLSLDITSEKLYDLAPDIPDVMGLRALRPSAAVVKVMSVPDSQCIRVVTPDDHVNIGFHEILLHDMGEEELPFMATSQLDYLRRIWPHALFDFMSRYQQDMERMQKECKERTGCTQSGNCTHCGKYIQRDLGKHIAFYHMELAQLLWRFPVMWCTMWKGTAQDCIDHMRRIHKVPLSVKAANLARFFSPWTVTREQWADIRPRFARLTDGPRQIHPPWSIASDSPASPAPARLETSGEEDSHCSVDQMSVSSACLNLDLFSSSSEDDSKDLAEHSDLSITLFCDSDEADRVLLVCLRRYPYGR